MLTVAGNTPTPLRRITAQLFLTYCRINYSDMYTHYFGLTEKPFAISPNPRYLFMSERHREALAHLLYGIESDGCIFLLTGDVGTGKTTMCRCLLEQLPEKADIAIVLNPKLTARDLLITICEEFGVSPSSQTASIKTYIDILNSHLLQSHAAGRVTAVIIDEAQNLDINVLEQLRMLTNLETDEHKLLRIFLIGQPELRDILNKKGLTQINQRITGRYHLSPLQPADVHAYIHHRLSVAGYDQSELFSKKAIKYVVKMTRGIPRLINVLCDRALLGAYAENSDHVSYSIMKKAGHEIFPQTSKVFSISTREVLIGGAFLCSLALAAFFLLLPNAKDVESESQQYPIDLKHDLQEVTTENAESTVKQINNPKQEKQVESKTTHSVKKQEIKKAVTTPAVTKPDTISRLKTTPPQKVSALDNSRGLQLVLPANVKHPDIPLTPLSRTPEYVPNPTMYTIKISAPLIVLEKAGPTPQEQAMNLLLR